MFKNVKFLICLMLGAFQLNGNATAEVNITQIMVSLAELVFDQDAILVNINGSWCPVNSLVREENQWMAEVDFGRNAGYCQSGHDLCTRCGLCHLKGCRYYVPPCWGK